MSPVKAWLIYVMGLMALGVYELNYLWCFGFQYNLAHYVSIAFVKGKKIKE